MFGSSAEVEGDEFFLHQGGSWLATHDSKQGPASSKKQPQKERGGHENDHEHGDAEQQSIELRALGNIALRMIDSDVVAEVNGVEKLLRLLRSFAAADGYFEESYRVPAIVRAPGHAEAHGTVVHEFTENIDFFPTICEALGLAVPAQCDGMALTAFLEGHLPSWWRSAAAWEFDWRYLGLPGGAFGWPWDRHLERNNLAVRRFADGAYVQFGDGSWLCYDIAADPTWRTEVDDPSRILGYAQSMLAWRAEHTNREVTSFLLEDGGVGRWPTGSAVAPVGVTRPGAVSRIGDDRAVRGRTRQADRGDDG